MNNKDECLDIYVNYEIVNKSNIGYCVYSKDIFYFEPLYTINDNDEIFDYIIRKIHATISLKKYSVINIHSFKEFNIKKDFDRKKINIVIHKYPPAPQDSKYYHIIHNKSLEAGQNLMDNTVKLIKPRNTIKKKKIVKIKI